MVFDKNKMSLEEVLTACRNYDKHYIDVHRDTITDLWKNGTTHESGCICGCTFNDSLMAFMTCNITDREDEWFIRSKSIHYLLESGIIDPDIIIDGQLLLAECLHHYAGWQVDRNRLILLLSLTTDQTIRNYRGEDGETLFHVLTWGSMSLPDELFDTIYERFIAAGLNPGINYHHKGEVGTFLAGVVSTLKVDYVRKCLDMGHNPNDDMPEEYFKHRNIAMDMLVSRRNTKNVDTIHKVVEILTLLVDNGLNLLYTDSEGRNIQDYVHDYEWSSVPSTIPGKTMGEYLTDKGALPRTGRVTTYNLRDEVPGQEHTAAMRLLYDRRYEKNPDQIKEVLDTLKSMHNDGVDLGTKVVGRLYREPGTAWDLYCSNTGPWAETEVETFLREL